LFLQVDIGGDPAAAAGEEALVDDGDGPRRKAFDDLFECGGVVAPGAGLFLMSASTKRCLPAMTPSRSVSI
jgi:hypothetical protein